MREMDKWKDKVELSLDNRQIFFLFFGLSVVGCFVFALGVMVGRRVDFGPDGQVAALAGDGLAMFDDDEDGQADLSFKQGLAEPAHLGLPETRDPEELENDKPEPEAQKPTPEPERSKPEPSKPEPSKSNKTVLSAGSPSPKTSAPQPAPRKPETAEAGPKFTLQMKAFSKKEDAEAFAAPLRANGHAVRVEEHEIKGRVWHRVRVGKFENWQDGLAAKDAFEAQEKVIAYVVRL
jgi:cell division septation protein DedD